MRAHRVIIILISIILLFSIHFYVPAQVNAQDTIKIGGVGPLSAPGGVEAGEALKAGMQLAVGHINTQGGVLGKKIELIIGDTGGLPEKGATVAERLISSDKVIAITGEAHSSVTLAEMEVVHKYGIPFVVAEASSDTISAKQYPEVFRLTPANSQVLKVVVDWIKALKAKHVVLIAENSDWGLGLIKLFGDFLGEAKIKIDTVSAERTAVDFTPQLLKIKAMKPRPDLILDGFTGTGEFLMIKQAYELGIAPSSQTAILGLGQDILYPGFWESVKEGGIYTLGIPGGLPGVPSTAVSKKFGEDFKKAYNREGDPVAMEGYEGIYMIVEAIKKAGNTDSKKIISALEEVKWTGPRGDVWFTKERQPNFMYHQWLDVPVFVTQYTKLNQNPSQSQILWPKRYATTKELLLKPKK